jgi:L-alanine-DL-glutamate epimerase-like enolase superfamily enzyme
MQLHLHPYELHLAAPFKITYETRTTQPTLIAELRDGELSGYGEATATRYYGMNLGKMQATLEELRDVIEKTPLDTPEQYWASLQPHLQDHPFELCALDVAANDLWARRRGQPLYQLWGLESSAGPMTNYTIGIGSIEDMKAKIEAKPWPLYKIKLGTGHDIEIIHALRTVTGAPFRVDANTAWTAGQTIENAPQLADLGVEFIEQPLKADDWAGMRRVFRESVLPVIADESCQREADVEKCHLHFHGINIKLMKCGGLTPARRMIARARELGMKVMVGCMTESTVGISAIAQLRPLLDYVDMDGPLLLKEDIATGVYIDMGKVYYPDKAGTGVELNYPKNRKTEK